MKHLILIRHGKSSWEYDVGDADRPLGERGIKDAHLIAKALTDKIPPIEAVYSSPACRALHTAVILIRELGLSFDLLKINKDLYDFSGSSVKAFVHSLPDNLDQVMIFGHNHAFTNLANSWGSRYIDNVPTAGFVHLSFEATSWEGVAYGKTQNTLFPRELK